MKPLHELRPGDTVNVVRVRSSTARDQIGQGVVKGIEGDHLIVQTSSGIRAFWRVEHVNGPAGRQSGNNSGMCIVSTTPYEHEMVDPADLPDEQQAVVLEQLRKAVGELDATSPIHAVLTKHGVTDIPQFIADIAGVLPAPAAAPAARAPTEPAEAEEGSTEESTEGPTAQPKIFVPYGRKPMRIVQWLAADTSRTPEDAVDPSTGKWKTEDQLV